MEVFGLVVVLILGLTLGSFITCISWRIPRDMTFLKGRSICPHCKAEIAWHDNIPVISYLLLGGKCRNCKKKISIRYPIIELSTATLFVAAYLVYAQCSSPSYNFCSIPLPLVLFNLFLLITIAVTDLEKQIIPDEAIFVGFFVNLFVFILMDQDVYVRLLSAFGAASALLVLHLATKGKGMGLGDVKFALFGGILLTPLNTISWLMLSFIIGGVVGILLIVLGKAKFGAKIAFGPYLVLGLLITLILNRTILFLPI